MVASCKRNQTGSIRATLLIATAAALIAGIALLLVPATPEAPVRATVIPQPIDLPDFELVDHHGAAFNRDSLRDRWSLVFFGFTHCPDICPLTLQKLSVARRQLAGGAPASELPEIVFVSVDPDRDTAKSIGAYVSAFGDGVTGVRGELEQIDVLTSALGIFHARPPTPDGGYDVEHSAAVLVINEAAQFQAVFSAPHDIDSFVSDLKLLIDEL